MTLGQWRVGSAVAAAVLSWTAGMVGEAAAQTPMVRMIVADLPYSRVWDAALAAVQGYPLERAADGVIVTGRVERAPRAEDGPVERVAERVRLRLEAMAERITRVTVEVEAEGLQAGVWVPLADTESAARAVLARLRAAQG